MKKRSALKVIAACAGMSISAALLSACSENKPKFSAIDITDADYARDFSLTDHNGQARSLNDFAGKVVVLFFGYTHCTDVCPTSMSELAEVKKLLGSDGERLQGLFVTVDPERDTPAELKAYMQAFDPTFLALYTTPEKLATLAKDYRLYYKKVEGKTPGVYDVDHTAVNYVYDTKGKLRLYSRYGAGAQVLAADIRLLLQNS